MKNTGKIHIYYGYGKGKTTAAMGQVIRAAGSGLKVLVFQFLKDNTSSERKVLENIPGIVCLPGPLQIKFSSRMTIEERKEMEHYHTAILDELEKSCASFDILLMDEALCAVKVGLLKEEALLRFLERKPQNLELILTGHEVSQKLLDKADYVTELRKIKHPYDEGLPARKGIEF